MIAVATGVVESLQARYHDTPAYTDTPADTPASMRALHPVSHSPFPWS